MGSCAAPSAKGDDKFITTDYLQQCPNFYITKFCCRCCHSRTPSFELTSAEHHLFLHLYSNVLTCIYIYILHKYFSA
ncbi:hypothetical protein EDL82_14590 [Acinetobacter baumannii]|nr:hypothetical protein EDL82_14590 [Acinetobacter baumannii]RZV31569.1 hypothetical protein EAS67_07435 [Acinetobacter baumannii]